MKRICFINAVEIEHHIFVFLGSTDSLSWTPTEETVLRVEKKWAGAIGIPLHRGGQQLSDGGAGIAVAAAVEGDGRSE